MSEIVECTIFNIGMIFFILSLLYLQYLQAHCDISEP